MGDRLIYDEHGEPVGKLRPNQDPEVPQRMHPVPQVDHEGNPVMRKIVKVDENGDPVLDDEGQVVIDREEAVIDMVPIHFERAQEQLAKEGLMLDGVVLVERPAEEPASVSET